MEGGARLPALPAPRWWIELPSTPGLGLELDAEAVERCRTLPGPPRSFYPPVHRRPPVRFPPGDLTGANGVRHTMKEFGGSSSAPALPRSLMSALLRLSLVAMPG